MASFRYNSVPVDSGYYALTFYPPPVSQVPMEDLQNASKLLVKALRIREDYMHVSRQSFPSVCQRFLDAADDGSGVKRTPNGRRAHNDKATIAGKREGGLRSWCLGRDSPPFLMLVQYKIPKLSGFQSKTRIILHPYHRPRQIIS